MYRLGDDFSILTDESKSGIRHISAQTSSLVCSTRINFDLSSDGKIHNLKYEKGCQGNLRALGRLVEGMDAKKVVEVLQGVDCHERGTSCSDQLTRIIAACLG